MKTIPSHISASQAISAATHVIRSLSSRRAQEEARRGAIPGRQIGFWTEQHTAVSVWEMMKRLSSGGGDDYCI